MPVALKERATRARIPIIYANDNFGKWRSDSREQLPLFAENRGRQNVELQPAEDDFV
jgi:hypothetical protein